MGRRKIKKRIRDFIESLILVLALTAVVYLLFSGISVLTGFVIWVL